MSESLTADADLFMRLEGVPPVDINENLRVALAAGRRVTSLVREAAALRYGPMKLAPQEYFYYQLWNPALPMEEKRRFVGKVRQKQMHDACNNPAWRAAAADKVLWQTVMMAGGLPVPTPVALTQVGRSLPGARTMTTLGEVESLLRQADQYPFFAKPIAGRYSLGVISAAAYDASSDSVVLTGGVRKGVGEVARALLDGGGFLIQERLQPRADLAEAFGPRLWSVRLLVLLTESGPVIHRAVAKIATGSNPADNFWRPGNMLGAIDKADGRIARVVRGTGNSLAIDEVHPDTNRAIVGKLIPDWEKMTGLVQAAALLLPGIRTQSWDVALANHGPVLLEVNYGGDLNLSQLAHGKGVLDDIYADHLRRCGFRLRSWW